MLPTLRIGTYLFGAVWITALASCDETQLSIDASPSCTNCPPAERPLEGRIVHRFDTNQWNNSGGTAIAVCDIPGGPSGTLLGGKCLVKRTNSDTAGPFIPRLVGVGDCEAIGDQPVHVRTESYCCNVGQYTSDLSSGFVTAVAICLYPPGMVPPEQPPPEPL